MQTIKLSRSGFWFKYWAFISFYKGGIKTPSNTCTLKRNLITNTLAMLLFFPMFVVVAIVQKLWERSDEAFEGNEWWIPIIMFQILGFVIGISLGFSIFSSFALMPFPITLAILVLSSIGIGLGFIGYKLVHKYFLKKPKSSEEKHPNIIKVLYDGWKEKLCSKIEYIP